MKRTLKFASTKPIKRRKAALALPSLGLLLSGFIFLVMLLQAAIIAKHPSAIEKTSQASRPISPHNLMPPQQQQLSVRNNDNDNDNDKHDHPVVLLHHDEHPVLSNNNNMNNKINNNNMKKKEAPLPSKDDQQKHTSHTSQLPQWMRNYIQWHQETLLKYPGDEILTNPNAPNILVRVCLGLCGGLHDRLGQLPWDIYLANQTQRMLFMKWERPKALENFFMPNELNWTWPAASPDGSGGALAFKKDMKVMRAYPELFSGFLDDHPEPEFWKTSLDFAIQRATTGNFSTTKVLRHRILGHLDETVLEQRLLVLGETDMIHWTQAFGHLFWTFFQPSLAVKAQLNTVYQEFKLTPGHYSAVHCRVRHPKATPANVYIIGKSNSHPADKSGLPWYGSNRDFAVSIATKAVYCARTLSPSPDEPIYFFSDSNDLVRYMAHELTDPDYLKQNATFFQNDTDKAALKAIENTRLVARDARDENAHIDRQKGREAPAYYGTFVDFLLAVNARCVTYGIGYYAIFATKISGIDCKLVYQEEEWGGREGTKIAPKCTKETYQHLL